MQVNIDQMNAAVDEAKATLQRADSLADKLARLLIGRLRRVSSPWVLWTLKKELADYNMRTSKWR